VTDSQTVADIRGGVLRLARRLRAERQPGALTGNAVAVLGHLRRYGPATPGQIAAADGQQPQSLTRTLRELHLAGLIRQERSDRDGRESVLTITARGSQALRHDMAQRDAWLSGALGELTEAETQLLAVAAGLLDRLAALPAGSRDSERRLRHAG
jgi:DNA-binding MarR family transcriptional regulator